MPNIELKARYEDFDQAREVVRRLDGQLLWKDNQTDTYFFTKAGKLKLRESGLNGSELIPYVKSNRDGLKRSDYAKVSISDPLLIKNLLTDLLGQKLCVRKNREVFLIGNVRVHLDHVEDLGKFIEFEAVMEVDDEKEVQQELTKIQNLMEVFGIEKSQLLDVSYPELLQNF